MTILISPTEIGTILDLKTFEELYLDFDTNSILGIYDNQKTEIFGLQKLGIHLNKTDHTYKVTGGRMGLIIQIF